MSFKNALVKPASTVIILKKIADSLKAKSSFNYEILFVKRASKSRFFPGFHVFPGGVVEESDADPALLTLLGSPPGTPQSKLRLDVDAVTDAKFASAAAAADGLGEHVFRGAAVREVFEESNVVLGVEPAQLNAVSSKQLKQWRFAVQKESSQLAEMLRSLRLSPRVSQLRPWAHWITPTAEKFRYNTMFYITMLQHEPDTLEDSTETTAFDWLSPAAALEACRERKIFLAPPTWYLVHDLMRYPDGDELIKHADRLRLGREITSVLPSFNRTDLDQHQPDAPDRQVVSVIALPGDALLDTSLPAQARHRIVITADNADTSASTWRYSLHRTDGGPTSKL
eukprot:TRINITY_DN10264_c0_g2_i1.p2 TRINITY_DN10264_c0_g2~~TRINITY_DN10264_c0_g2_i1.p2  ORF type:complete len:340 (+),score=136.45 TRINITY_DN10264_c0_g2_i1:96-1115(+)